MQRDANMLVPDAQQPPADQDNDIGDPCPEDDEFFDRPDAFGCVEWESQLFRGVMHARCYPFNLPKKPRTRVGRRLVMAARMMVPEMKCELDLYECVLVQT